MRIPFRLVIGVVVTLSLAVGWITFDNHLAEAKVKPKYTATIFAERLEIGCGRVFATATWKGSLEFVTLQGATWTHTATGLRGSGSHTGSSGFPTSTDLEFLIATFQPKNKDAVVIEKSLDCRP